MAIGATRSASDKQVLDGMQKISQSAEFLKDAVEEHGVLSAYANDARLPKNLRNVFQSYAERWTNERIPQIMDALRSIPDVPERAKEYMFTPEEYLASIRRELEEADMTISALRAASRQPSLKDSAEVNVAKAFIEKLHEKGASENATVQRLLAVGDMDLRMALNRYVIINAIDERRKVASIRWDVVGPTSAITELREIEDTYTDFTAILSRNLSKDLRFPEKFRREMGEIGRDAEQHIRSSTRSNDPTCIDIRLPAFDDTAAEVQKEKELLDSMEWEALNPSTGKDRRDIIMKWREGLRERIEEGQTMLSGRREGDPGMLRIGSDSDASGPGRSIAG